MRNIASIATFSRLTEKVSKEGNGLFAEREGNASLARQGNVMCSSLARVSRASLAPYKDGRNLLYSQAKEESILIQTSYFLSFMYVPRFN